MLLASKNDYAPPFAEQLPTGELLEYGPSPSTYARHLGEFKLWAWRPDKLPSRLARSPEATALRAYMHAETADEREQIAQEIARLDGGGARLALADLAEQALKEQP